MSITASKWGMHYRFFLDLTFYRAIQVEIISLHKNAALNFFFRIIVQMIQLLKKHNETTNTNLMPN